MVIPEIERSSSRLLTDDTSFEKLIERLFYPFKILQCTYFWVVSLSPGVKGEEGNKSALASGVWRDCWVVDEYERRDKLRGAAIHCTSPIMLKRHKCIIICFGDYKTYYIDISMPWN